jgi:hypothetical protein
MKEEHGILGYVHHDYFVTPFPSRSRTWREGRFVGRISDLPCEAQISITSRGRKQMMVLRLELPKRKRGERRVKGCRAY